MYIYYRELFGNGMRVIKDFKPYVSEFNRAFASIDGSAPPEDISPAGPGPVQEKKGVLDIHGLHYCTDTLLIHSLTHS